MESAMVNARVPRAKKEAGAEILESLGATTTELVNGAFDYLLANRQLPDATPRGRREAENRTAARFAEFEKLSTLSIDWGPVPESVDYRKIIAEGKRADYESLA